MRKIVYLFSDRLNVVAGMPIAVAFAAILTTLLLVSPGAVAADSNGWWDSVKMKGDLRYRHEMIDVEGKDPRNRHRIRARVGIFGKVSDYTKVGIQMATGSDDPVSTNQTLDGAFSTKDFRLDLAYMETTHERLPGLKLTAGKFKNPFFKPGSSELIWDSDWNPEGGVLTYDGKFEDVSVKLIGSGLWIDERSSGDDSWMGAAQGMVRFHMNEKKSSIALGGGYFNYANTKGFATFWDDEDAFGNSVDTAGNYMNDYDLIEVFGEFTHHFDDIPVTVMADFVTNTAADSLETGWLVGMHLGKVKKPGSWALRYIYREIKKDAAVGLFADSDFRGGGTDARGHEMGGSLQLADNTTFNVSYFANTIGLAAAEEDFGRLQVDVQLKF